MFSCSVVSRRVATMAMSRGALATKPIAALFSTRAYTQAEAVEELLMTKHWADVKDNMKEIRELMDEVKTNHAVHLPDAQFEGYVVDNMEAIQQMIRTSNTNKAEIADRVFDLKMEVKGKLYHA
jgi:DNA-binding transcriptional MerR regulator